MRVTKGDNGNVLSFNVNDDKGKVDLTGATVKLYVTVNGGQTIEKPVNIINGVNYQCESVLDGDLFTREGIAYARIKVEFAPNKTFNSVPQQIIIN